MIPLFKIGVVGLHVTKYETEPYPSNLKKICHVPSVKNCNAATL